MNFRNATAYEHLENGTPYIFMGSNGEPITITTKHIPIGSILYRVDKTPNPNFGKYPEFMGNHAFVATTYSKSNNLSKNHLTAYVIRHPLNLVCWTLKNIENLIYHPKANQELLSYYLQYKNTVQPLGYLPGINENIDRHAYVNRLMSNMVCEFGMDGWIVQPNSLRWHIWGREEEYAPEVVLCPSVFMLGGKSVKHRKRRNTRRKRPSE